MDKFYLIDATGKYYNCNTGETYKTHIYYLAKDYKAITSLLSDRDDISTLEELFEDSTNDIHVEIKQIDFKKEGWVRIFSLLREEKEGDIEQD